jgi:integrase
MAILLRGVEERSIPLSLSLHFTAPSEVQSHKIVKTDRRSFLAHELGIEAAGLAGHSLRAGLATTASRNGASEASIMRQTGHRSVQMVRRYRRSSKRPGRSGAGGMPRNATGKYGFGF